MNWSSEQKIKLLIFFSSLKGSGQILLSIKYHPTSFQYAPKPDLSTYFFDL